ncbi:unnamed protein product, partial [Meganyctiphanes norvegica]
VCLRKEPLGLVEVVLLPEIPPQQLTRDRIKNITGKTKESSLERHDPVPINDNVCKFCGKKYFESSLLKYHIRSHSDEKPFECSLCNYTAKHKCHVCRFCGRIFADSWYLKYHLRSHSDEKPFKCSLCNFTGKHKSRVKDHLKRKHNIFRPVNLIENVTEQAKEIAQ